MFYYWIKAMGYSTNPPTKSENHWAPAKHWTAKNKLSGKFSLPLIVKLERYFKGPWVDPNFIIYSLEYSFIALLALSIKIYKIMNYIIDCIEY